MKKMIILVCLIMLLTGCVKIDSDTKDYKQLINNCLSDQIITNNVAKGYKFYVPRGVKLIKNYDYNQTFLVDDTYIYMYVDIISYFYKNSANYKENTYNYNYYQELSNNEKFGYIGIKENDKNYYVKIIYNYAKIEFYTDGSNMPKLINMAAIILNNIEYKNLIIENILENNSGSFSSIKYEVDKPEDASSNFSQFLEEVVQEETEDIKEILPDE